MEYNYRNMKIINCYIFMTKHFSICLFYEFIQFQSWCTSIHMCAFICLYTPIKIYIFWWEARNYIIPNAIWVLFGVYVIYGFRLIIQAKERHTISTISYQSSLIHSSKKESKGIVKYFDSLISLRVVISLQSKLFIKCDRKCIPEYIIWCDIYTSSWR